ncbi:MAG: glycoside hydrolase domain-containing protein, partial [Phycisphaeraceae bacterium]
MLLGVGVAADARADVRVWNYHVLGDPFTIEDPGEFGAMRIVGTRNGSFSGAVAVESDEPIEGLRANLTTSLASDDGAIADDHVQVRYALPWERTNSRPPGLDILQAEAPRTINAEQSDRILAGVWVTVAIPDDLAPGTYRGELTINARNLDPQTVDIELTVIDWRAPDPGDWRTWIEMIQSPDTLAIEYDLELWSDEHFDMIARSFELIRTSGSRVVYVPLIRETNQGNEQSMVRWIRKADGSLEPDYSIMERYLDIAQEHLGELDLVVFYAWDAYLVMEYRGNSYEERPEVDESAGAYAQTQQRRNQQRWDMRQKGLTVTIIDEATGEVEEDGRLPLYLDAEASREIWKPVYDELRVRMRSRGLEDAMALSMVTDVEPTREEVEFFNEVTGGLPWIAHSHPSRISGKPSPNNALRSVGDITYQAHAYNLVYQVNPEEGRMYGWDVPERRAYLCRFGLLNGPPLRVRQMPLLNITGNQRGVGRLGGDFWTAVRDGRGRRAGQAFARYPENHWRGLNINSWFLAPGVDGPVATARLENLREGVLECEARIVIESVLIDDARRQQLDPDLAERAQQVLDDHHWVMWRSIWTNEEELRMLGRISGRSTYEAIWGGLSNAGVDMPGFWEGAARNKRSEEDRKGLAWYVAESNWQDINERLFTIAAEVQRAAE